MLNMIFIRFTQNILYHRSIPINKRQVPKTLAAYLMINYSDCLVVDKLVSLVVPAVELTNFLADLLCGMFGSKLSHSLEVNLLTCG